MPSDPLLARLRRNALLACGAIALVALVLDPHRPAVAIGVLGGGVLVAISYLAVSFTINAVLPRKGRKSRQKQALAALVFAGHYALLALAAYVMIGRLRLHPIGLLGGVTSFVVAVALEARRPKSP
jgi:ATP synthase I subunit